MESSCLSRRRNNLGLRHHRSDRKSPPFAAGCAQTSGPRAGIEGKLWRLPEYAHAGILYVEPPLAVAQASNNGAARLSPQDRAVRQAPFAHRFFDDRGEPARDVAQEVTAAIDRLFHQCTVVEIAGERYPAPGPRRDRAGTQVNAMCR